MKKILKIAKSVNEDTYDMSNIETVQQVYNEMKDAMYNYATKAEKMAGKENKIEKYQEYSEARMECQSALSKLEESLRNKSFIVNTNSFINVVG